MTHIYKADLLTISDGNFVVKGVFTKFYTERGSRQFRFGTYCNIIVDSHWSHEIV